MKFDHCFVSDLEVKTIECSLCHKSVEEGYFFREVNDEESEILERKLGDEPEDWFICEQCVGGLCENPDAWLLALKNK